MSTCTAEAFGALHHGRAPGDPLVLPGPWDAASARVFEEAGFPALATPSAGVAAALGHADGSVPPREMFDAIGRVARAVSVPVSADVEDGYGLPARKLVGRLLDAGVVGCNLEDSWGRKDAPAGTLKDPREQADYLAAVREVAGRELFVNARVDTYLRGAADFDETVARARLYVEAGADCVYVIKAPVEVLPALRAAIGAPLNVLCPPGGPSPQELGRLGATRVTFGPGLHHRAMEALSDIAKELA
ncbi:isocitrate lyase/PEP mutase family protein [Streptomyces spectabilis]|uniref:2-methylisocitrate lyase-like PEP mutase family enzyme n=1 Tax=Streptomyces spectabilis TaxID=68270 RepID=A0A5P2XEW9_STRST|nr:isocitrate lyase/phosphoenolpyruvate mutase family protein [Streptomyces spectabilis]MBB5109492.1 2-methylisocitrate lyase-like PEP mutase family enzyme [Streptomyces spectabilis]MCI3904637.1 isocitrate lyase/phosphoenolpyruvate mutase family protein [Streptomyces spectabilis]QEV61715.1 isocitrate lyase/phosphoenolpyruvate mutase family protein [Streptomyces spectabilis]GGV54605.1 carboxyvinyl-carboxyphosphonate phosphorylmutase [Streptomyces spectabilis]